MANIDFDRIEKEIIGKRERKKDMALAIAKCEIAAIEREYTAYWDGVYDAIKAVKTAIAVMEESP